MRILLITNKVPYPPKDGGAIATFNMAKGLADLGHEVFIYSLNTNKHFIDINTIPEEIRSKISFIATDINTDINPLAALKNLFFSRMPYNAVRFLSDEFKLKLEKLIQTVQFDIIQLEGLYLAPYIPSIRKYSNAPIIYRAHNIEHEIWQRTVKQEKNAVKKQYIKNLTIRIRKMEERLINNYDGLIPITKRDANKLQQMGNIKPSLVSQTGFDLSKINHQENKTLEFPSIFHIGSLDWTPNQEGILWFLEHCWQQIKQNIPDVKFYIAGRNAPDWFKNKMNQSGVVFKGEIEDAYEFMHSKAVMIVPLLSGSGMRIKIIEGMALGKAIVSTSIGSEGIPSIDNENILIADNPSDFTLACEKLLKNKAMVEQIGLKARGFITENFNNLAIAKELAGFYEQLLKK